MEDIKNQHWSAEDYHDLKREFELDIDKKVKKIKNYKIVSVLLFALIVQILYVFGFSILGISISAAIGIFIGIYLYKIRLCKINICFTRNLIEYTYHELFN